MSTELVFNENGKALTNSLLIAQTFDKEHARVMRDIRELSCSEEFRLGNFADTSYLDRQGKRQPMYNLTRDGFTLLVMGYTGKKAMQFKEAYINAFNQMEQAIKKPTQLSELEIIVRSAQALLEQSKRLDIVESRIETIEREREENRQLLISVELSEKELPVETENSKIRGLVNAYVKATGVDYRTVWETIYGTLESRYKKRIKAYSKTKSDKSLLDVAIRNGLGEYIYIIISNMIKNINKV